MKNNYKKKLILFGINFILYSILLIYKYANDSTSIKISTVIEGYFLVNLFYLVMILPILSIHRGLRTRELFLNNEIFSRIIQIILLIISYIVLIIINSLKMPIDVMSSMVLWLYLYFCIIFKSE